MKTDHQLGADLNLISILKELWRRRVLVVLAVLAAAAISILAVYDVSTSPPQVSKRSALEARGSISILIDSTRSPIADAQRDLAPLQGRAGVFARYMAGGTVIGRIAEATGIPETQIAVAGPEAMPGQAPGIDGDPSQAKPYGIAISQQGELPIITVETRAPTIRDARALAAASPVAIRQVVHAIQREQETPQIRRVQFRVLGPAQTGVLDDAKGAKVALLIFVVALAFFLLLILGLPRLVSAWRGADPEEPAAESGERPEPMPPAGVEQIPAVGRNGHVREPVPAGPVPAEDGGEGEEDPDRESSWSPDAP